MDDEEFSAFFAEHYGAVLGYGLRRVDPDTARDVTAGTFLVAWRRVRAPLADLRVWLLAVARRVLANELRRRARADHLRDRIAAAAGAGGVASVQPDHAEAVAASDRIAVAMRQLSTRDQEVLQLIAWEGLDQVGAAAVLGCSVTAAKVRLHRARQRLSVLLRDTGPHADLHAAPHAGPGLAVPPAAVTTSAATAHVVTEDLR